MLLIDPSILKKVMSLPFSKKDSRDLKKTKFALVTKLQTLWTHNYQNTNVGFEEVLVAKIV